MSILEMAKIWLAGRLLSGSDSGINVKEFRELGMIAYKAGANAVLEEIEEAYYKEIDLLKTCDAIKIKIEELKENKL